MRTAIFPGTFDPPSLGHLDIIKRAQCLCDTLYVGIALNRAKEKDALFSLEEKIAMLQEITKEFPYVKVISFEGLVVHYAKTHQMDFILRGLRAFSDFEYEFRMALANRKISGVETVFLMADERHAHISSSLIKEIGFFQNRLKEFVPSSIEEKIFDRLSKEGRK